MTGVDQYRRWFEYEKASNAQVIASLHSVSEPARQSPEFKQAVTLLAHLVAARRMWLHRLGATQQGPASFFPTDRRLDQLEADFAMIEHGWDEYLDGLAGSDLGREFEYQSTEGDRYRNRIEDILTQLFGHSLYHRGQIALLVRSLGGTPAETDFIFWTRRKVTTP